MDFFLGHILHWILVALFLLLPVYGVYLIYTGFFRPKKQNTPVSKKRLIIGIILVLFSSFVLLAPIQPTRGKQSQNPIEEMKLDISH